MYVSPETLQLHIAFLRDHFEIVPLSLLAEKWEEPSGGKPLCALTFDDGWWDFYRFAYPIFLQEKVPATVFLPTDFIGTSRWFWTDELGEMLEQLAIAGLATVSRPLSALDPQVQTIIQTGSHGVEAREDLFEVLKKLPAEQISNILDEVSEVIGFRRRARPRAFLTWQEVQEMFESGHITFGSHTASHALLTTVSAPTVFDEMIRSKDALLTRGVANAASMSFSYPNGNHSPKIAASARAAGYKLAVVTTRGWHLPNADPYTIKRIAIHQDISDSNAMFGARIAELI